MATSPSSNLKLLLTQANEEKKKNMDSKNCGLKKCFSALVDRKQVNLELEVLRLMLRKELGIHLDTLNPELANVLPYLLVYYIKNWPGWQKSIDYYSATMSFKTWYEKFHNFITIKLNEAITIHFKEAVNELNKERAIEMRNKYTSKKISDKNTQTDNLAPKVHAPFTIEIMSKPVLLNTIVFTDTPEGDIILKQHKVLEWDKAKTELITLKQLITWPHVGIHMLSPIFSFTRKNLHEFRRHISLIGTPLPSSSQEFIEDIRILNHEVVRKAYTIDFLRELSVQFMDALKGVQPTQPVLRAFQTVIDEFLNDIEDIDIRRNGKATIANNTAVLFNIGKCTYFRNKKLFKGCPSRYDIGYTELIIPKIEVALTFIGSDEKIDHYLKHLRTFNAETSLKTGHFALPQITFSCNFCQKEFSNGGQVATHLKDEHKMEQPMLCAQCKQPFPALELSKVRWNHPCTVPPKQAKTQR